MEIVRIGIIGCGGMGRSHMRNLQNQADAKFVAASDSFEGNLNAVVEEFGVRGFADANEMLDSGLVDAVIIATPHYFHPTYAIAAMKRGIHVLSEKPLSVTVQAADEVNAEAAKHPNVKFGLMYQRRASTVFREAKNLIESGQLGEIQRVHWTITTWFRTQAYYDSGSWRATWEGEGGGVLLNQCPHNLDILWWLAGTPSRITAKIGIGKYHKIEVEDEVTAFLEYPNGATGLFVTSTGEAPGTNYFEIVGDRGKLVIGNDTLDFYRTNQSVRDYSDNSTARMGGMTHSHIHITPPPGAGGIGDVHSNFINAILHDEPLLAPGVEGVHSVELANAMIYSGIKDTPVDLPLDRKSYDGLLAELIENARCKKGEKVGV